MTIAKYGMSIPLLAVFWGRGKPHQFIEMVLFLGKIQKIKIFCPQAIKKVQYSL
jgi:hypothetical protein